MKKEKNRVQRLQSAKQWLLKYEGKNIVKGYRKHFGVDIMCAIAEIQMLDYEITPEYSESVKRNIEAEQIKQKLKKAAQKEDDVLCCDSTFYYIAGYTSGGAPYGITWEEMGLEPFGDIEE
jgi:hypothetical protein